MKLSELKKLIKEASKEAVREVLAEQLQITMTPVGNTPLKEGKTFTTSSIPVGPNTDFKAILRSQFEQLNDLEPMSDGEVLPSAGAAAHPGLSKNPFAQFITPQAPK